MKNDVWIREMAQKGMIDPFVPVIERVGGPSGLSHGLSSYGYDIRLGTNFKKLITMPYKVVDLIEDNDIIFENVSSDGIVIDPNSFVLGESLEYFKIPRDVIGLCVGKSTYARLGIIINVTPLEPEWEGRLTIEITNTTRNYIRVHSNMGIAQLIFLDGNGCETSYADRVGKYQYQTGVSV